METELTWRLVVDKHLYAVIRREEIQPYLFRLSLEQGEQILELFSQENQEPDLACRLQGRVMILKGAKAAMGDILETWVNSGGGFKLEGFEGRAPREIREPDTVTSE